MEKQKPEQENQFDVDEFGKDIVKITSRYLAVGLAAIALVGATGLAKGKAKEVYRGVEYYLQADSGQKRTSVSFECSDETQQITVKPGENQWSLEEKNIEGINLVLRSDINTQTIERHPGDGILERGDKVVMPQRCWREVK